MRLKDARKLHNGDQVRHKDTGEYLTVVVAYPYPEDPDHYHAIEVMTEDGYKVLCHKDVE